MHLQPTPPQPDDRDTDLQLLERWRAGDLEAGARLFERHYAGIQRFFSNKVGRDCEDLIQSTFLGCLEAIDGFRGESSFRTLLFAIARFKLLKHLRERKRDHKYLGPARISNIADRPSFNAAMAASKERKRLLAAMRRLPLDTQLMLELFYWEAMPVKDIALVVDLPDNTVKTRMRRGRQQLVKELDALDSGPQTFESSLALERWAEALRRP